MIFRLKKLDKKETKGTEGKKNPKSKEPKRSILDRFDEAIKTNNKELFDRLMESEIEPKIDALNEAIKTDNPKVIDLLEELIIFFKKYSSDISFFSHQLLELEQIYKQQLARKQYILELKQYDGSSKRLTRIWNIVEIVFKDLFSYSDKVIKSHGKFLSDEKIIEGYKKYSIYCEKAPYAIKLNILLKFLDLALKNKYPKFYDRLLLELKSTFRKLSGEELFFITSKMKYYSKEVNQELSLLINSKKQ